MSRWLNSHKTIYMKQTLITKFLNHILRILGFTSALSCISCMYGTPKPGDVVCMYGTPTMDFEVTGKVVNKGSEPLAGIEVSCRNNSTSGVATALTAEDGSFYISGTDMSPVLEFKDIDGLENGGEFAEKTQEIEVIQIKKGDGDWYMGKYEAKDVVIEMVEVEEQ